jgi:paraquat-inducible protein B
LSGGEGQAEGPGETGVARLVRSRWPGWIWAVPIAAIGVTIWLGVRAWSEAGPTVTVVFDSAEGITAGSTPVKHKGVEVGTVRGVTLTPELENVELTLQMDASVADSLRTGTKFWIVSPRLGVGGVSGLRTILSGPYVAMIPGPGEPADHFEALPAPPIIETGTAGRRLTLITDELGSLDRGSVIYAHGIAAGEVEGYRYDADQRRVVLTAFVRAPFASEVEPGTVFWRVGGVEVETQGGIDLKIPPLPAMIAGGVAFGVNDEVRWPLDTGEGPFELYATREAALHAPIGPQVAYAVRFPGPVDDLEVGSAVELAGRYLGRVTHVGLLWDSEAGRLTTPVTVELDPARLDLGISPEALARQPRAALDTMLQKLVRQGYRAQLQSSQIILGQKVVLARIAGAPPEELDVSADPPVIPAAAGAGLADLVAEAGQTVATINSLPFQAIARDLRDAADHIATIASSPELEQGVARLEQVLARLDRLSGVAEEDLGPVLDSVREAADAAQATLQAADRLMGESAIHGGGLAQAVDELANAARSVRALADTLVRHPEALLRGR